jgi:hypothetical protein
VTLTRAVAAFLGTQLLATTWAATYRLPYDFGGHGAPDQVLRDFWSHGTALSAPAPVLVVVGILSLLARRRGRAGTVATTILMLLMAVALITGVLEPAVRQALEGGFPLLERAGILVLTIVGLVLALLMIVIAGGELRHRIAGGDAAAGAA